MGVPSEESRVICERCHGRGERVVRCPDKGGRYEDRWLPCPQCEGTGRVSCCCDGGRRVPDTKGEKGVGDE